MLTSNKITAQQFVGDNQWVAPHGVATVIAAAGQNYAMVDGVIALFPEWEFNLQLTHYYDDPRTNSDSYTSGGFFVKRRIFQNEDETAGYAFLAGTGIFPQHLDEGEVTSSFQSWWIMGVATYAFANNTIFLDLLPGVTANFDHKQSAKTAWGFTYSSRVAIYKIIPKSAIVGEIFGTAGKAFSPTSYRAGVRWESPKWIVAATYSNAFDGSYGLVLKSDSCFLQSPFLEKTEKREINEIVDCWI